MKRSQITMLAGLGTMTVLILATGAHAQAKGEAILPETDPNANQSIQGQRGIKVEWTPFERFDDVINNSHVILRGKVVKQRTVIQGPDKDVPLTISTVAVNHVVRRMAAVKSVSGDEVNAGHQILIVELGGKLPDGSMLEPEAAPVLRDGEEALFFLRSQQIDLSGSSAALNVPPGAYHVTGGFQGRWAISGDGLVHPLSTLTGHTGFLDRFSGRHVDDVIKELQAMPVQPRLLP